ncbi:MAG: tail fiber domain-containing protein [Rhodothermales bacterium]|nr:tail fiber domain-containing protein [Rhodothermales bacterium]
MPTHPREHPIRFTLLNPQHEPSLLVSTRAEGHVMHLALINRTDQPLVVPEQATFELVFHDNVLVDRQSVACRVPDGWRWEPLRLTVVQPVSLAAGEALSFTLTHVKVDEHLTANGTRVELKYQLPAGDVPARAGLCLQHLALVRHLGQKLLPVHIGFVGVRTIPTGTPHQTTTLRLRITNTGNEPLAFTAESRFTFSFDVGEPSVDWALGTADQVAAVVVKRADGVDAQRTTQGGVPSWTVLPFTAPAALAPGHFVDILFSHFVSQHPPGETNLYIAYEGIPGFWDGRHVVALEKAAPAATQNAVGGLTMEPSDRIKVNFKPDYSDHNQTFVAFETNYLGDPYRGRAHLYAPTAYYTNEPALTLAGNYGAGGTVGINKTTPQATLHVGGNIKTDNNLLLEPTSSIKVNFQPDFTDHNQTFVAFETNYMGDKYRGRAHLYAPTAYYANEPALTLAGNYGAGGTVGINKTTPEATLHVGGDIKADGTISPGSDRASKEDILPVEPADVLAKVLDLPINHWRFKADAGARHIGPMAQDFHAAFDVGADDRHISVLDADGVALAAIQGLHALLVQKEEQINALEARLAALERGVTIA